MAFSQKKFDEGRAKGMTKYEAKLYAGGDPIPSVEAPSGKASASETAKTSKTSKRRSKKK